jgi:alpha-glucosidase
MKFWLDRGVDGFRLDAAPLFFKDPQWRDNPANPDYRAGELPDSTQLPKYTRNQPGLHELFAELRALVDGYRGERVLLGEFYVPTEELVTFYGDRTPELHLPLNLSWTWAKWQADAIGPMTAEYQAHVAGRGWPTTMLDTHDQPRIAARAGVEQARVAALLLLTQRGTPTLYYGDEIGMRGVDIPSEQAVEPWLPVGVDRATANVATQSHDAGSLLTLTRRLLELRARESVLQGGVQEPCEAGAGLVAYRRGGDRRFLVVANLMHAPASYDLRGEGEGRVVLSTFLDREGERVGAEVRLRADEGLLLALEAVPGASRSA